MMVPTWCCWVRLSRWWARCSATGLWGKSARRPAPSPGGGPPARPARSPAGVVVGERIPDPAQRLQRLQGAVERQPAHSADQTQRTVMPRRGLGGGMVVTVVPVLCQVDRSRPRQVLAHLSGPLC